MRSLGDDLGIPLPVSPDLPELGVAAGIVALALGLGWAAGRLAGPPLARLWERRAGTQAEGMASRMDAVVRHALAWALLSAALAAHGWRPLAALPLGLLAASAAALLARHVVRGLHVARIVAWLLAGFLFVAVLAGAVGGLAPLTEALDSVAVTLGTRRLSLLSLIQTAVALAAVYVAVRLAIRLAGHSISHSGALDPTQRLLTQKLVAIAFIALGVFIAIDLAGIDLTALAVFSGALGLAIGFGLQKTIGNLFAGIILLMDRSIKPGDVISVGESFGSVSKIGVRAVSIVTRDGKEYLIPNEILMTEEVVNWSYSTRNVRISIPVGISYDSDVKLAQELMIEAAASSPRVLKAPKPVVWMTGFGDSAIDHEIRIWIRDPEAGLGSVRSEILDRVLELFRSNGVQIPYPQRDVHLKDCPAAPAAKQPSSSDDG